LTRSQLYVLRETGHQVMQERPRETLALIEAFVEDMLERRGWRPGAVGVGGGVEYTGLRKLLAEGPGTGHAIHPGQFPVWARAEHEQEEEEEEEEMGVEGERGEGKVYDETRPEGSGRGQAMDATPGGW
jgi:hypothetical protein